MTAGNLAGRSFEPLRFPHHRPGATDSRNDNLPSEYSSFVGREQSLVELRALLGRERLTTLHGTGGVGKTRLALRVAGELRETFPDGVWFVELALLADPALVEPTVARSVGVPESPGRSLADALLETLKPQHALLVLDNCEHLIDACAQLADALLRSCPQLHILATSRQPLGLSGEHAHRVSSLASPPPHTAYEHILASDAVRLFVERAQAVDSDFRLTPANAPAVVQICQQLDGIPLALELAAARVRGLSAEQLAERLCAPLQILIGGNRAAPPRHQTMRAAIDWSYQLLSASERRLLARLVVFVGGSTLEAVEAVCGGDGILMGEIVDLLLSLVDKSLVVVMEPRTAPSVPRRYTLLEPSRAYLAEELTASGEERLVRSRHAEWCQRLTAQPGGTQSGPGQGVWLRMVEPELDNVRAALDWLSETGAIGEGLRLAESASVVWLTRGYLSEGRMRMARLLSIPGGQDDAVRAKVLLRAAQFAEFQGDYAEEAMRAEAALAIFRELGDPLGVANALSTCGSAAFQQGRYDIGCELLQQSMRTSREAGDSVGVSGALMRLASIQRDQGDFASAHAAYDEALELRQRIGDRSGVHHVLSNLGWLAYYEGDYRGACSFQEASLAIRRELNDPREIAVSRTALAKVALMMGDRPRARALLMESLPTHQTVGNRWGVALALEGFAGLAAQNDPPRALRLAGAAAAMRATIGRPLPPAEQPIIRTWLEQARAALLAEEAALPWSAGSALTEAEAIAEALVCPSETMADPAPAERTSTDGGLTRREVEVASLIARGYTNRRIAEALVIAERTAETHVERIMNKLALHSRAQVAAWAAGHGLLA